MLAHHDPGNLQRYVSGDSAGRGRRRRHRARGTNGAVLGSAVHGDLKFQKMYPRKQKCTLSFVQTNHSASAQNQGNCEGQLGDGAHRSRRGVVCWGQRTPR
eukprot:SAG31_NODE_546_length_14230_cov_18.112660_15_plen_101_part_00